MFLAPLVLSFLATVMTPFILGVFYSMTDWTGVKCENFVGLENYAKMFKTNDYIYSHVITAIFTVMNMFLVNALGFALALLCSSKIRGKQAYRMAFFIPNLIGGIVLGYVWQFIFNKVLLSASGGVSMLSDPNLALSSIVIVSAWQYSGYIMMIYYTGLQTVPTDVLEAAQIDGANTLQTMARIKIPMISQTFTVCIFLTLVNSFKQFDLNLAITAGAPSRLVGMGVYHSTEFLALNIYNTVIGKNQYALGQTKAVVFFVLLAAVSLAQVAISKRKEVEM
jgi:raffinose/stachyose/melibiose transport system permease protein